MKEKELKELKLTKNIIIPFPNFQPNTIISPTQINDNFEEIEYAYNNLIDLHNGAISKVEDSINRSVETIDRVQGVENDLQDSERKRILNENTRITNESVRISSENIRIENENTRIANEAQREQQELERMSTYQTHINDEIKREEKHNQMIGTFNEKVGELDEAIASIPTKQELKGEKGDKGDRGEQGVKGDTPSITHLETSINNKINEVETRFNTLTSSQQQASEVIDARDGETSLKARLDRDLYKDGISLSDRIEAIEGLKDSQNMKYETDKGYLVCKETKNGVIDDLKIEGKTLVNLCPKYVKNSDLWANKTFESDSDGFVTVHANGTWLACPRLKLSSVNNLKPSTKYTLVIEIKSNTLVGTDSNCMNFSSAVGVEYAFKNHIDIPIGSVGTFVYTVNTLDSFENVNYLFRSQLYYTCTSGTIVYRWYLLEGDHTQNPPSYFEGLMSVGQDVDKIEVSSVKGDNLKVIEYSSITYNSDNILATFKYVIKGNVYIHNHSNKPIYIPCRKSSWTRNLLVPPNSSIYTSLELPDEVLYAVRLLHSDGWKDAKLNLNAILSISNEPINQDKKQILFYNENGELEPIQELHEWDSIEKHSDNKWYYHKRSGKVVLNGSEDWTLRADRELENSIVLQLNNIIPKYIIDNVNIITDKFNSTTLILTNDVEGIYLTKNSTALLRINKSKLSTQDLEGFKQWLQTNNVTVVYQLAQEEVYELAPLHLDSYANETLILCNSGAISPKMEFSITSHINELVKSQGDRISLLEEKMYKALKQVLAGDMYSLAELLYPEDFVSKEEPIDVPTLLI